ncbi:hypothetical protein [Streptosporangium sp. OZ121]|uniref:hypothetical protein n=1 Tax=Streptosporangium sp. OZ121 TaxID=3444183 RepID=UPI003F78CA88
MSVYHYVAGKDDVLDGIVELVFGEIESGLTVILDALATSTPATPSYPAGEVDGAGADTARAALDLDRGVELGGLVTRCREAAPAAPVPAAVCGGRRRSGTWPRPRPRRPGGGWP